MTVNKNNIKLVINYFRLLLSNHWPIWFCSNDFNCNESNSKGFDEDPRSIKFEMMDY